jgi:hypothetical protein
VADGAIERKNPMTIKEKILTAINTVAPLKDYNAGDCIFSGKYPSTPATMVYILLKLAKDFNFTITDDFVDSLEMCTFGRLEELLEQYKDTIAA